MKANTEKTERNIQLKIPPDLYKKFKLLCDYEDTNMRQKLLKLMREYTEKKDFFVMNKNEQEAYLARATDKAIADTHEGGRPSVHGDEKGVYELYPDGHKEYIKTY